MLLRASDEFRAGASDDHPGFYVGSTLYVADVGEHLPVGADGSLEGYAGRIASRVPGGRFAVIAENLHVHDAEVWMRIRDFLHGLFEVVGIPGPRSKTAFFFGNYASTPLGLHAGGANVFKFVLSGRKRMRLWPDEALRHEGVESSSRYAPYLDRSIVLEGGPGDVCYWPARYWHIGESVDGGLVASLSVNLFDEGDLLEPAELSAAVEEHGGLSGRPAFPVRPSELRRAARSVTRIAAAAAGSMRAAAGRGGALRSRLELRLLNRLSADGFARVPPPLPPERLDDARVVTAEARRPILWRTRGGELVASANGHGFSGPAHPGLVALLERLSRGGVHRVGDLVAAHSATARVGDAEVEAAPEDVRALLEKLVSLRALR